MIEGRWDEVLSDPTLSDVSSRAILTDMTIILFSGAVMRLRRHGPLLLHLILAVILADILTVSTPSTDILTVMIRKWLSSLWPHPHQRAQSMHRPHLQ